jgi:hypothetical protein
MERRFDEAAVERAVREELGREPSVFAEGVGVFRGRRAAIHIAAAVVTFALFAVCVYAAVRFFGVSSLDGKVLWSTLFLASLIWVLALKVYFWIQMMRNAVLREVKRVELRVAEGLSGAEGGSQRL